MLNQRFLPLYTLSLKVDLILFDILFEFLFFKVLIIDRRCHGLIIVDDFEFRESGIRKWMIGYYFQEIKVGC